MNTDNYIKARKTQLRFYRDVELYARGSDKGFVLYKRAGIAFSEIRLNGGVHPDILYIRREDRLKGLQEAQKGFNSELATYIKLENPKKITETVNNIVSETLTEPRSGSLEGVSDTVGFLVSDYVKESDVIENLLNLSYTDYSVVLHSINVMAFALGFAFHMNYSKEQARELGLCALLHDVGKTKINPNILAAPRRLTDQEFEEIKSHPVIGFTLLKECKFASKNIGLAALEHHEKTDGSGYPQGKSRISEHAKIIGLIDCYEALTTDDRPYREAMVPFETLNEIIGNEVNAGKFDQDIYIEFIKSLGSGAMHPTFGVDKINSQATHQIDNMR